MMSFAASKLSMINTLSLRPGSTSEKKLSFVTNSPRKTSKRELLVKSQSTLSTRTMKLPTSRSSTSRKRNPRKTKLKRREVMIKKVRKSQSKPNST